MKLLALAISLLLAAPPDDMLTGRWETKPSETGSIFGIVFKMNHDMEAYKNKKPFASGKYIFNSVDRVLSFIDNGCSGSSAIYKVNFFSNGDSLRFTVIMDTCTERRKGIQLLVMGRKK